MITYAQVSSVTLRELPAGVLERASQTFPKKATSEHHHVLHDDDAVLGRCVGVDVVDASARTSDELEVLARFDHLSSHLRRGAHNERVVFLKSRERVIAMYESVGTLTPISCRSSSFPHFAFSVTLMPFCFR